MKSAVLSGKANLCVGKLWNPTLSIQSFHHLPPTISPRNPRPLSLGLSFATSPTTGRVGLSECSATLWHCNTSCRPRTSWSIFWKAGHQKAVNSPEALRRQFQCYCFGILNLDSTNMSGRLLRVRKGKETTTAATTTTVLQLHTVRNGIRSTAESSQGEVEKLNKENFGVDSWQFQLLERHEANNLNSYTVAELRQLLREMKKQPKGQKSDLLKAVKSWLYEHGCQIPSALEDESNKATPEVNSGTPEEVETIVSKTRVAVSQGGMKRAISESAPLTTNRKRGKKGAGDEAIDDDGSIEDEKPEKKSLTKVKSSKKGAEESVLKVETAIGSKEPWTVLVHKKPQPEWVAYNPKTMRPPPLGHDEKVVKLLSWNVNGLRALLKEKGVQHEQGSLIARLAAREDFDVLCLQETKLQEKDVEVIKKSLLASHEESLWSCSTSKLGYSGTAIISRIKPLSVHYGLGVPDHDKEGRLITCEFDNFYLLVSYVPNSGDGLKRLEYRTQEWDVVLSSHLKELEKKKPVILTGDLNCAHEDIDIHDPAGNKRSAGFTDEERASFVTNFLNRGFVDTFRKQYPNAVAYTYWGYRSAARPKNKGWRLDYFLVSEALSKDVHDSYTIPDVGGSDHCPIGLILRT